MHRLYTEAQLIPGAGIGARLVVEPWNLWQRASMLVGRIDLTCRNRVIPLFGNPDRHILCTREGSCNDETREVRMQRTEHHQNDFHFRRTFNHVDGNFACCCGISSFHWVRTVCVGQNVRLYSSGSRPMQHEIPPINSTYQTMPALFRPPIPSTPRLSHVTSSV